MIQLSTEQAKQALAGINTLIIALKHEKQGFSSETLQDSYDEDIDAYQRLADEITYKLNQKP